MKIVLYTFVLLLAAVPAYADIPIALVGPFSGNVASFGEQTKRGVRQAVSDFNAKGGSDGEKLVLQEMDDACDPKQAVALANKILSNNIDFELNVSCSGSSEASEKIYLEEGKLIMTAFASHPRLTDEGGSTLFRAMYRDDVGARVLEQEILSHFRQSHLAIIHDNSVFGRGIAEDLQLRLHKKGMNEVFWGTYDPSSHDFSSLIGLLKQKEIDTIFFGGFPVQVGQITRQLRQTGSGAQIIAMDLSADFGNIAGKDSEGALFVNPPDPRKLPTAKPVIMELEKDGFSINGYALYAYAATQVLAEAIARTGSKEPSKVAATIHKESFDTILGLWSFDQKGDVRNIPLVMYKWHNGSFAERD